MKLIYKYRYLFYSIIIALVSTYLIFLTYGYKINWHTYKFEKTGLIYVASLPTQVNVYAGNNLVSDSTPLKYDNLFPGRYDFRLENEKYQTWEKTFNVKADFVEQAADIVLILKDIEEIPMTDAEKSNYQKKFTDELEMQNAGSDLIVRNTNELYFQDVFVTRMFSPINNPIWFADKKHIIFQSENKINFMDSDGSNIKTLVVLADNSPVMFLSSDNGMYLIVSYKNEIKKYKITEIKSLFGEKYLNRAVKIIK